MINLSLEHYLDVDSEIIVRPYEYSYEELVELVRAYDNELLFNQFEDFCESLENNLDKWNNVFTINNYISIHGVDAAIKELVGEEGLLTNVKDSIVAFAKWLWKKLVDLINWIKNIFSSSDNAGVIEKDDINKPAVFVKKAVSSSKNAAEAKKILSKLDLSRQQNITVNFDYNSIKKVIGNVETFLTNTQWDYKQGKENLIKAQEVLKIINSDGTDRQMDRKSAAEAFATTVGFITKCRSIALGILHVLNNIVSKKVSNNLSPEEAKQYVLSIQKELKINESDEVNTNNLKEYISTMRASCGVAIRLSNSFVKQGISIITQLYFPEGDYVTPWTMDDYKAFLTSSLPGVDLVVPIPPIIQKKLNDAWGRKFRLQRIIISNVRGSGIAGKKLGLIGANVGHVGLPNVEIFMTPNFFAKKLELKKTFENVVKNTTGQLPDVLQQIVDAKYERVETFMKFMVHELRHTWQSQTGFKYGKVILPGVNGTQEDYEASAHEVDARKAVDNYKVDDSDRKWVKEILFKLMQQARKNRSDIRRVKS